MVSERAPSRDGSLVRVSYRPRDRPAKRRNRQTPEPYSPRVIAGRAIGYTTRHTDRAATNARRRAWNTTAHEMPQ
jgi:hypothetical protein